MGPYRNKAEIPKIKEEKVTFFNNMDGEQKARFALAFFVGLAVFVLAGGGMAALIIDQMTPSADVEIDCISHDNTFICEVEMPRGQEDE